MPQWVFPELPKSVSDVVQATLVSHKEIFGGVSDPTIQFCSVRKLKKGQFIVQGGVSNDLFFQATIDVDSWRILNKLPLEGTVVLSVRHRSRKTPFNITKFVYGHIADPMLTLEGRRYKARFVPSNCAEIAGQNNPF